MSAPIAEELPFLVAQDHAAVSASPPRSGQAPVDPPATPLIPLVRRRGGGCGVCREPAPTRLLCPACVARRLEDRWQQREALRQELHELRAVVAADLQAREELREVEAELALGTARAAALKDEVLALTRRVCNQRVQLASRSFALQQRLALVEAGKDEVQRRRTDLATLREILGTELGWVADTAHGAAALRRCRRALSIFRMFGVSCNEAPAADAIMGVPLPADATLWPRLPEEVFGTALGLVVRLTLALSEALNVPLPHRLFHQTPQAIGRAAVGDAEPPTQVFVLNPTWAELSHAGPARAPSSVAADAATTDVDPPLAPTVQTGAVACRTALALLQNDVLHLCVKAGVSRDKLHASEAMLWNLTELHDHCCQLVTSTAGSLPDLPLPDVPWEACHPGAAAVAAQASQDAQQPSNLQPSTSVDDWELVDDQVPATSE